MSMTVGLQVGRSVCPRAYLWNHEPELRQIFRIVAIAECSSAVLE